MTNAKHFAFIEAFITLLTAAGFTSQKILDALALIKAKFAVERRWYGQFRASETIALRMAADHRRDSFYSRLRRIVLGWAGSGMEQLDHAATELKRIFDLYRVNTKAQLEDETGQLDNFIKDLETDEMQGYIALLNATYLFQEMKSANEQVKSLRLAEGIEASGKMRRALATARQECDLVYDSILKLIEASSLVAADNAPYEQFIIKWNGTIKIFRKSTERKSSGKDEDKDNDDGGGHQS